MLFFVDFGVYTNANPMLDFDTTKRFDVYVRCSDNKNYDEEQLIVIVKKNAIPDFTNLPSKELSLKLRNQTIYMLIHEYMNTTVG